MFEEYKLAGKSRELDGLVFLDINDITNKLKNCDNIDEKKLDKGLDLAIEVLDIVNGENYSIQWTLHYLDKNIDRKKNYLVSTLKSKK